MICYRFVRRILQQSHLHLPRPRQDEPERVNVDDLMKSLEEDKTDLEDEHGDGPGKMTQ